MKMEKRIAAQLSKTLMAMCVRNTEIEDIHSGITPITRTGDYSDVKVIDAEGREICWNEASRISNDEMKVLMKRIVNRMYTFFLQGEDPRFHQQIEYFEQVSRMWDEPEIDPSLDCTNSCEQENKSS